MEGESKLINKFYPWTIDVDTNATKSFIRKEISQQIKRPINIF